MKKTTQRKMNAVVIIVLGFNVAAVIGIFVIRSVMYPGDLLDNGSLRLETAPAPGTVLSDVETCAHPNELIVTGHVRRDDDSEAAGRGELTITLLSPAGKVLDSRGAWYNLPPGRGPDLAHFEAHMDTIPPGGSVMRIEWAEAETGNSSASGSGGIGE